MSGQISGGHVTLDPDGTIDKMTGSLAQPGNINDLKIGDWVLEIVPGPVPALKQNVEGPFLLVGFIGKDQQIARLETGSTELKVKKGYKRHVNNLARYVAKHHLRGP
jgi:hypothetical protein